MIAKFDCSKCGTRRGEAHRGSCDGKRHKPHPDFVENQKMVSQIIDDIEKEGLRSELCVTRIPFEVVSIDGEPVKTKTYFWAEPSVAKKITKLILEANNEQRETEEAKSKED